MTSDAVLDAIDAMTSRRGFPVDHLSPSFINKYEQCPLAALYYRQNKPKEWDPRYAEVGSYIHSLIEREYNPSAEIVFPSCGMDDMMTSRAAESMAGYRRLRQHDPRYDPAERTQHPEVLIRGEIAGVPLIGYIDLLSYRGGRVYIDDWKTGKYKPADEQQLRIYTMLVSMMMGIRPGTVTATLDYLRDDRIQRPVPYTSTAAIEGHIIKDVIEPIQDLIFVPHRGQQCARCEYRPICEAWK